MNSATVNVTEVDHYYRIDFHVNRKNLVVANVIRVMLKDGATTTMFIGQPQKTKSEALVTVAEFFKGQAAWLDYSSAGIECPICHRKHHKHFCPQCGHQATK